MSRAFRTISRRGDGRQAFGPGATTGPNSYKSENEEFLHMLMIPSQVNTYANPSAVSGYSLAMGKAPAPERAFTAARLVLGDLHLVHPRITQAAKLAKVSRHYVEAALEVVRSADDGLEAMVREGMLSLFEAAVLSKHPAPSLPEQFKTASPAQLAHFGRVVGPERLWEDVIIPAL
jgi:hypothetical protein